MQYAHSTQNLCTNPYFVLFDLRFHGGWIGSRQNHLPTQIPYHPNLPVHTYSSIYF